MRPSHPRARSTRPAVEAGARRVRASYPLQACARAPSLAPQARRTRRAPGSPGRAPRSSALAPRPAGWRPKPPMVTVPEDAERAAARAEDGHSRRRPLPAPGSWCDVRALQLKGKLPPRRAQPAGAPPPGPRPQGDLWAGPELSSRSSLTGELEGMSGLEGLFFSSLASYFHLGV